MFRYDIDRFSREAGSSVGVLEPRVVVEGLHRVSHPPDEGESDWFQSNTKTALNEWIELNRNTYRAQRLGDR